MTEDQKDFVVELIRNTIDYLHKQEVLLIQLAGSIEASKKEPKPTPAEDVAESSIKFYKELQEKDPDDQYPFPWGRRLGKKADDYKPGLTNIVSEAAPMNVVGDPCATPIRDAMVHGVPVEPGEGVQIKLADEPPRGAWE